MRLVFRVEILCMTPPCTRTLNSKLAQPLRGPVKITGNRSGLQAPTS